MFVADSNIAARTIVNNDVPIYVDDYTGYLYSKGRTALWNGTDYTTSTTTASPNAKSKSSEVTIMDIQLNSSGERFGSSLYITNIKDEPDSPEEAVIFMNSRNASKVRVIPLYDSEGKTVIGKFEITPSNEGIQKVIAD